MRIIFFSTLKSYNNRCYINCPEGPTISNDNICIGEIKCPEDSWYIITGSNECSNNCSSLDFFKETCKLNNDSSNTKDEMINIIRNDLLNGLINSEEIYEENKDLIVQNKNMIFQVTTPEIQNINSYKNISIIQIGVCENILRELYKL